MELPKQYLSYSQLDLFLTNKPEYRRRYYLGQKPPPSPYMLFGKEVAEMLEDEETVQNHPTLSQIPRLPVREKKITADIDGVPFLAYLDAYDPDTKQFYEVKTSKYPWDAPRVRAHLQLPVYSLCIERKEGTVVPDTKLIWLGTQWGTHTEEFDGITVSGPAGKLELTGEWQSFDRRIAKWERDRAAKLIRETAQEIEEDYTRWQNGEFKVV